MVLDFLNITRDNLLPYIGLAAYSHSIFFELIDIILMCLAIGYIFSDVLVKPVKIDYDPIDYHKKRSFVWENIKYAAIAAGPAVVLHELSHKIIAMAFGAQAVLYAPYGFYLFVILLKLIGFPFLFFVGGFVVHTPLPALQSAFVSLAGPLSNLLIWAILIVLMRKKLIANRYFKYTVPLAKISIFLAIFNMLPLPGFDGFSFFSSIFSAFF